MDSAAEGIFPRRTRCGWYNGVYYDCRGGWYHWGRWVLAGAALLVFFLVLLSCCCLARRRRKRGVTPYYGTGWMAPNGGKFGGTTQTYPMNGHQTGYYNNNNDGGQYYAGGTNPNYGAGGGATYNPPPAYGVASQDPQYAGNNTSPNNGYFGNSQYNTGPQSPPNAYQRDNVYPPPPAPPGGK
jgi:hypothetical protein